MGQVGSRRVSSSSNVAHRRSLTTTPPYLQQKDESSKRPHDPRIWDLGRQINNDYSHIRERYATPKYPLVLAHGLMGFSELKLWDNSRLPIPSIQYWHGIKDALVTNAEANGFAGCSPEANEAGAMNSDSSPSSPSSPPAAPVSTTTPSVISCTVPPSASIASRAEHLAADIARQLNVDEACEPGKEVYVNIIAHSMGGLDARYLISRLKPRGLKVASLTTIATPHRGSCIVDLLMATTREEEEKAAGGGSVEYPPASEKTSSAKLASTKLHSFVATALRRAGLESDAFMQLSREYLEREFNPHTPDDASVRYFSYGASIAPVSAADATASARNNSPGPGPGLLSPFRLTWAELQREEGANDGIVSVRSSQWGEYKGTLVGVSHVDLINWTNRVGWTLKAWLGIKRRFNAVAFYLDIADMLAKEGL